MRLEYRFFAPGDEVTLYRRSEKDDSLRERVRYAPEDKGALWLRWYPDENFAEAGIAPPTDAERAALERFNAADLRRDFPAMQRAESRNAFAAFAADVGSEARAAHLWRTEGDPATVDGMDPTARRGRICGLPARVQVFALAGDAIDFLGEGSDIPAPDKQSPGAVNYGVSAVDPTGWITDFEVAEKAGMGLKITDPDRLEAARRAEWIVAVGLSKADGRDEIERLLADMTANGNAAFLRHADATNNAGEETTGQSETAAQRVRGPDKRFAYEDGVGQLPDVAGNVLARSFGLSQASAMRLPNAGNDHISPARAMIRAIGPVLLDDKIDGAAPLASMDESELVEELSKCALPRGLFAPLRLGRGAYGIVPLAEADTLATDEIKDVSEHGATLASFTRLYARALDRPMAEASAETTQRLRPEDPDAAEKLDVILRSNASGRRIEVFDDADEETPLQIACPYVDGTDEAHLAANYLDRLATTPVRGAVPPLDDPLADDKDWPLLYRLVRRSLARNQRFELLRIAEPGAGFARLGQISGIPLTQFSPGTRSALAWAEDRSLAQIVAAGTQAFPGIARPRDRRKLAALAQRQLDALHVLGGLAKEDAAKGTAVLEELMVEVIDLCSIASMPGSPGWRWPSSTRNAGLRRIKAYRPGRR
ncbi:MAG: hypothetical protein R3D84_03515 [Paracoccaceae bacterium]